MGASEDVDTVHLEQAEALDGADHGGAGGRGPNTGQTLGGEGEAPGTGQRDGFGRGVPHSAILSRGSDISAPSRAPHPAYSCVRSHRSHV